jgi:hypothetical protein
MRCARMSRVNVGSLYNAEAIEKSVEDMQIEASRRGYAFAVVHPSWRPQLRQPHGVNHLRDRRRPAHLYRAHRHPRQQPHPRLRDPPRIRSLRRRRLQPRAGRPRRAPAQEPRLLQDGQDHHRARLLERSRHPDRRSRGESRPATSRSRAAIRPPTARSPRSASPSAICSVVACSRRQVVTYGQYARRTRCRSSSPICSTTASRSASISISASNCPTATSPTAPRRWASARGSASACAKICRCNCATRSISRKSPCRRR